MRSMQHKDSHEQKAQQTEENIEESRTLPTFVFEFLFMKEAEERGHRTPPKKNLINVLPRVVPRCPPQP